jgi:signal peptidase I
MGKILRIVFWTAVFCGLVVGVARLFLIRWWRVPEDEPWLQASVAPTIAGGDLIVLWRFTKPTYGDLVLCPEPDSPDRVVIARLAAEEGDRIRVAPNGVWINGKKTQTERNCGRFEVVDPNTAATVKQSCDVEDMAGVAHHSGATSGHNIHPATIDTEVQPGKIFLLSDNRLFPFDSRDFGQVDRETCKESVVFRLASRKGYRDVDSRFTFIR